MLKYFRNKNITKMVLWGILILILPAFVLWGSGSIGRSKEKGPSFVGIIAKKKVSFDDFYQGMTGARTLMILNYFNQPQLLEAFIKNKPFIAKLAWDRLIMLVEAKKYKIKIPDKDVISYIKSHPLFLRNDKFDDKLYEYILRYNMGIAPRNFEEIVRGNLEIRKLNDILTKDITVNENEILKEYKSSNERFKISYILIETKDFLDHAKLNDASVKDYYEKHKDEFLLPAGKGDKEGDLRLANFEDVKESIKSYLAEQEAKGLAYKQAEDLYGQIKELMEKDKLNFETAASKLGLKNKESPLFSKVDYLEGIGEAGLLVDAAINLKSNQISNPIVMRGGSIIFRVAESKGIDEGKFKKEKEEFAKKTLENKKMKVLDSWFQEVFLRSHLNIDLKDVEKYYR